MPGAGLLVLFDTAVAQASEPVSTDAVPPSGQTTGRVPGSDVGLGPDSGKLFLAMMRAIDLSPTDLTLATLDDEGEQTVSDLLAVPHRALLLFTHALSPDATVEDLQFRVPAGLPEGPPDGTAARHAATALPGWRCLHPDTLLGEPSRKREAWAVLKALKRALVARDA